MPLYQRNARRCARKATFSLRQAQPTRTVTSAQLKPTINWPLKRTGRLNGVTRRSSKRVYAWKRKTIETPPLRRFTRYWRRKRAPINGVTCFGTIKLDLTRLDYWRKIQSGNLPLLFMISSRQPEAAEAKKQKRV